MSIYKILAGFLVLFTALDIIFTRIGTGLGCVELNAFVNNLGLEAWAIFRLGLLIYLLGVYFAGYRVLKTRSIKCLSFLKNSLYALDVYIGAIAFSGLFHVLSNIPI